MKRFTCVLLFLCLLFTVCASAESSWPDSFPDFGGSWPDMPEFSGFDTDSWPSDFSMPEGWGDLSLDGFDGFPEDWGSLTDSGMEDWEEKFNTFKDQASGQSAGSSFPDWNSEGFDALKDAFQQSASGRESVSSEDIRDLFAAAFGESGDQTLPTPELPDLQKNQPLNYHETSGYQQISAIAETFGISGLSAGSLGSLPDYSGLDRNEMKSLFAENAEQLAVSMEVSQDRYCSLFSAGKNYQEAADAEANATLKSLYESLQN